MRVLAIDVGTVNVGWAHGSPGDRSPSHGVYKVPATQRDIAWLLADIRAWLTTTCENARISNIVYCSPILVFGNNPWTIRKINAIAGQIELFGYDHDVTVEEEIESRIRKHFLAPHKVPRKSAEIKAAVIARCRALGLKPELDDDADALALLDYTLALKSSRLAGKILELR